LESLCLYVTKGRRLVGEDFDYEFAYEFTSRYVSVALVFLASAGIAFINASAGLYFLLLMVVLPPLLNRLRPFHAGFIKWVSARSEETTTT
jgi:hypothetical protein